MKRRLSVIVPLLTLALVTAGCTTTVDGTGTRLGGGTSSPDFPSPTGSDDSPSPTDSGSGSGGSSDDADELVKDMVEDMSSVDSGFRLTGTFRDDGQDSGLDLQVQGDSGQGSVAFGGTTCQLKAVDGKGWANAPATFWTDFASLDASVAAQIADKWVELSGDIESLRTFVDQETFFDGLVDTDDDYTLGDTTKVGSVEAQEVEGSDGTTYTVATDSPHLLFAVGDDTGTAKVTFPESDLQVTPPSPTVPYPG